MYCSSRAVTVYRPPLNVVAFDPISVGYTHTMFNSAIVRALARIDTIESVHLLLAESTLQSKPFSDVLKRPKVHVQAGLPDQVRRSGRWRQIRRTLSCYVQMSQMFRTVQHCRSIVCVHMACDNLVGPLWLMFDRLVRRGPTYVILHNNGQSASASALIRLLWRGVFYFGVQPLVLARIVYEFFKTRYPKTGFILIPHPSYSGEDGVVSFNLETRKTDCEFLFLGRHGQSPRTVAFLQRFISACALVSADVNGISITIDRSVALQLGMIRCAGIRLHMYDAPVEHDKYYGMLRAAKFVVFPPDASSRISASGVHADAISYCVPVIAPARGVFQDSVPSAGLGLLYNDEDSHLRTVIARATGMSKEDYDRLQRELTTIRDYCDVVRTAERFEGIFAAVRQ